VTVAVAKDSDMDPAMAEEKERRRRGLERDEGHGDWPAVTLGTGSSAAGLVFH
jgi:hypothetical protein